MARWYTVTVEDSDGNRWNQLATDIAFVAEGEYDSPRCQYTHIALANPLGDDACLNPSHHSIIDVSPGADANGHPWFHRDGPTSPPSPSDSRYDATGPMVGGSIFEHPAFE